MTTNSTPKTLADLKYQEHVTEVQQNDDREEVARKFFTDNFGYEFTPNKYPTFVSVTLLFKENGVEVWEAYVDPGSIDYLYIKVAPNERKHHT